MSTTHEPNTPNTGGTIPGDPSVERTVWPCLTYRDAPAAIEFLTGLGFVTATVATGDDEREVVHAELRWPEGGGVMLGSIRNDGSDFAEVPAGTGSIYVVTDDPHPILAAAEAAGARIVRPMEDTSYGSTGFTVADPEGVLWSFGTYRGAP